MREKALLITAETVSRRKGRREEYTADRPRELRQLAESAGAVVAAERTVKLKEISPAHYIGTGKLAELSELCRIEGIGLVIFNNDLSPAQQQNLDDMLDARTIDRTQLILDIFARRARSNEGKIQVELAQLLYMLPRLSGKGVALSRLGGGIGTRGPGEQKLEVDRRKIRDRISRLTKEQGQIASRRSENRKKRKDVALLSIAIVGYTNAGKSTLLNALTGADVRAEDKLFCTLDPTTRTYTLPNNQKAVFSDTVGFLENLPHHLIDSFRATLEEVVEADLLLHVVDISHPRAREQADAVYAVLGELGVGEKTVISVLNKTDKIAEGPELKRLAQEFREPVPVSALKGRGIDALIGAVVSKLAGLMKVVKLEVPQHDMKVISFIHEHGNILRKEYRGQHVYIEAEIPAKISGKLGK